jgi:hypothetical protein
VIVFMFVWFHRLRTRHSIVYADSLTGMGTHYYCQGCNKEWVG